MSTDNSPHRDSSRALVKATSVISMGTLSSRILGCLRDIVLAKFFGTAFIADAFFVAWRIPNLFRDLLGEGAVNSTVVPVLSEYVKDKKELWRFIGVIFYAALLILGVLTILGVLFAPFLVRIIAPGFVAEPEKLTWTIRLTRIMFPYLIFIGLAAYSMGVLYTFRMFWVPAFSPCFLNVAMIGSIVLSSGIGVEPVYALAVGVLIGGILQLSAQMVALVKRGFSLARPSSLSHPGVKKVGRLLVPRLFGSGVYQLNIFVDTFCASLAMIVGQGGISAIYYANRLIQFPVGIFGFAMASAALPAMSGMATENNMDHFKRTVVFSLKNIFLLMFPATAFLMVLSNPVVRILFQRGAFDEYSTAITSSTLLFYAIGLFSFAGVKILVTAFHALQDTRTPVKVATVALVLNGLLNFLLMWPLKVGGIALASSIASIVNFGILLLLLEKRLGRLDGDLLKYCFKVMLVSGAMGGVLFVLWDKVAWANQILKLVSVSAAGGVTFLLLCSLFRVEQVHELKKWIFRKK